MRHIKKKANGFYKLEKENQSPPSNHIEATSRWKNYGKHKKNTRTSLNTVQYSLCCYSELNYKYHNLNSHIEHLKPKSIYPQETFNHENLVISALSHEDLKTLRKNDVFGGHFKGSNFDESLFLPCTEEETQDYFVYLHDGRVEPNKSRNQNDQKKAQYTIDILNLNCNYLVELRKKSLSILNQLIDDHLNDNQCLKQLAAIELIPSGEKLNSFFTANRQMLGKYAEEALDEYKPELL